MATIAGLAPHPQGPPQGPVRGPPQPMIGPFSKTKLHSDPERFICIYPAYFNSKKSINEGRRIPLEKCCEHPTYQEIKMVLDDAGYEMGKTYIIEGKYYPRERSKEQMFRGRFKVQLKLGDGELLKENFPSRDSIMVYLGEKIPQLKHRVNPPPKGGDFILEESLLGILYNFHQVNNLFWLRSRGWSAYCESRKPGRSEEEKRKEIDTFV